MTLGETVVAVLRLCVLSNSIMNRLLNLCIANTSIGKFDVGIETKLRLQLSEHGAIGTTLIIDLGPGPWLLGLLLKMFDLPQCPLNIHYILGNPIEVTVIGIVVSGIHIVIILAVPGDVNQRILQLAHVGFSLGVACFLAFLVAGGFSLLDLHEILGFLQVILHSREQIFVGLETNLDKTLLPRIFAVMVMFLGAQ